MPLTQLHDLRSFIKGTISSLLGRPIDPDMKSFCKSMMRSAVVMFLVADLPRISS